MRKKASGGTSHTRRDFFRIMTAGATGISLSAHVKRTLAASLPGSAPSVLNKWPGRVVINFNESAVGPSGADTAVIIKMVDDAVVKLTDQTTVGAAWKAVFPPSLAATSTIAIKVVTTNSGLPAPHWSSVLAITDGLQQMDVNGTPFQGTINIYEAPNKTENTALRNFQSAGFTADHFPSPGKNGTVINLIYFDSLVDGGDGALNNRAYAQSLKNADYLISVFSPRGHILPPEGSGFTLGFKSHFGTYSKPDEFHPDNNGDMIPSYIREIMCTGPVYNKLVLSICSGIYGMNEGNGPTGAADIFSTYVKYMDSTATTQTPSTIILSTDPISAEMQAIKMMRINMNGMYTTSDMPLYLQASGGIDTSGFSPTYNIGTIDENKMTVINIKNGVSLPVLNSISDNGLSGGPAIAACQMKGKNSTSIEFKLPSTHAGSSAAIEIFNMHGSLVRKFSHKVLGVLNHLSWDEKDVHGKLVPKGLYVVRLISGSIHTSTRCMIVR